ncbi:MAG: ABC transporter substrate-binding protein [Bacillota bacterium]
MRFRNPVLRAYALVAIAAALALTGCGARDSRSGSSQNGETAATRTFKTELGDLSIKGVPQRIVALNLQGIDSLVALDLKPVGMALPGGEYPAYLPEVSDVPSVGSHSSPSVEKVAALKPDLIILDPENQKEQIETMSKIAPVLGIRGRHWEDTMRELALIGEIVGRKERADEVASAFRSKLADYQAKAPGDVTVLGLYGAPDRFFVWTAQSFIGSLLEELKADYLYKGSSSDDYSDNAITSMEKVIAMNPRVIFLFSGKEKLSDSWKANPLYAKLDAAKNSRVYEMERNLWSRSRGPLAAGKILDQAAAALYPTVFPTP